MVDSVNVVVCFVTSEPLLGAPDSHTSMDAWTFTASLLKSKSESDDLDFFGID